MAPTTRSKKRDRLSSLPDEILVQILSFLPTIDAVRTCVLSKNWVSLWTHITSLSFNVDYYECHCEKEYIDCFLNFVSKVLPHLTSPTIDTFFISNISDNFDLSIFHTWYPALANKNLKNITMYLRHNGADEIDFINTHPSIFSCQTLVHLQLNAEAVFRVPNFIHLPNLQTLELCLVEFTSEDQANIILRFPVLKKLESYQTFWTGINSVKFEVPLLEVLEIIEPEEIYENSIIVSYNFITNPSVSIDSKPRDEDITEWGLRACLFFRQSNINQVKHLEISYAKMFKFVRESFSDLPTFIMLRHLKLSVVCEEILIEFLVKSPFLTSLTISIKSSRDFWSDHAKKLLMCGIVSDCISDTLKFFKIEGFYGHRAELSLAKYIMKNAHHLATISSITFFKQGEG